MKQRDLLKALLAVPAVAATAAASNPSEGRIDVTLLLDGKALARTIVPVIPNRAVKLTVR